MVFLTPSVVGFSVSLGLSLGLAFASQSTFILWALMEASIVIFIGLIACDTGFKASAAAKFFLSQSFLGLSIFFILSVGACVPPWLSSVFLTSIILCKLGMAPFHFWVPAVVKYLSSELLFVFLSAQKIFPLILLGWAVSKDSISLLLIGVSGFVSSVFSQGYKDFNDLLVFSSMVSMSWILVLSSLSGSMGMFCFCLYSTLLGVMLVSAGNKNGGPRTDLSPFCLVLLSGAPPGPIFMMKWAVLSNCLGSGVSFLVIFFLVLGSVGVVPLYVSLVCKSLYSSGNRSWGKESMVGVLVTITLSFSLFIYPICV